MRCRSPPNPTDPEPDRHTGRMHDRCERTSWGRQKEAPAKAAGHDSQDVGRHGHGRPEPRASLAVRRPPKTKDTVSLGSRTPSRPVSFPSVVQTVVQVRSGPRGRGAHHASAAAQPSSGQHVPLFPVMLGALFQPPSPETADARKQLISRDSLLTN